MAAPTGGDACSVLVMPGKELGIKLPPELPTAVTFRAWKNAVVAAVIGASHRSDLAAPWIHKVATSTVDFEKLAESEGFVSLDAKLAAGLLQMAKGALGR